MAPIDPRSTISHYRLDAVLGQGNMGIVHRGYDRQLGRPVAVKLLAANHLDALSRARFRNEALLLSRLNHPNIATLFEFGEADGVDYLVMELVKGSTVQALLETGPLPAAQVADLGAQLARGLAAAHAAGIIHRDIKPSNLCVTRDGLLKILDFGIAIQARTCAPTATTESACTIYPSQAGTFGYMAPERLRGGSTDGRSDIFSAGVVLYEMACGVRPFADQNPVRSLERMLMGQLMRPRQIVPTVPRALEHTILVALELDPDRRHASATELAADLDSVREPAVAAGGNWVARARTFGRQLSRMASSRLLFARLD